MKLILLHGPPAVGKLTVAKELSELTGIPLFHNHLTRDMVEGIYSDKLYDNYELVDRLRVEALRYCAKHDTDLIFTFVYEGAHDDKFLKQYVDAVESNGGEVLYVELTAQLEDLINRVDSESRKEYGKLTDLEIMKKLTKDLSTFSIPGVDAVRIDTSQVEPIQAARLIADKFSL